MMNEFCRLIENVESGSTVTLENGKTYHVRQDDSFELEGLFCTNSAKQNENPNGLRRTALFLRNKKNVVIDGNGATVLVHGKMTTLLLDHCENITLKNLTVDYACPTMIEFDVLENDDGVITIRIHDECLFRVEENKLIWYGEAGLDGKPYWEDVSDGPYRWVKVFDPEAQTTNIEHFSAKKLSFSKIEQLSERVLKCTLADKTAPFPAGRVVQTRNIIRDQVGGMFQRCKDIVFENLRVKFMHGLGMVSQFCENISYINCDFRPAEGRTIASTADFLHFAGCRGQITIDGCKAWGAQDDHVNVHGVHLRVVDIDREKSCMIIRFCHNETWGYQAVEVGDKLEFIRWNTLIPYGETCVTAYEKIGPTDIRVFVTEIPEGVIVGKDVVENASWTPDLHVSNCWFGPVAARGILCTTRGKVIIENNRFEKLYGAPLLIEDDCNFWFESGYTRDIVFRNNEIIGCHYAQMIENSPVVASTPKVMDESSQACVHGRLIIEGNRFEQAPYGNYTFRFEYMKDVVLSGNSFDAPFSVQTKVCETVVNQNNVVQICE